MHDLPDNVKDFITQNLINERQLIDILPLQIDLHFSPWLTTDLDEIAEAVNMTRVTVLDRIEELSKMEKLPKSTKLSSLYQDEIAEAVNMTQQAIDKRLKELQFLEKLPKVVKLSALYQDEFEHMIHNVWYLFHQISWYGNT